MANELQQKIGTWLLKLKNLTREGKDTKVTAKAMSDVAKMLASDFPAEAFTEASLKDISEGSEWFPTYANLRERLGDWWSRHKPRDEGFDAAPLSVDGKRWCAYWARRVAENPGDGPLLVVLNLIRSKDGEAYEWLIGHDPAADGIARGYAMPRNATVEAHARAAAADWKDPAKVVASRDGLLLNPPAGPLAAGCLSLLRAAVGKHAPENLHLLPASMPVIEGPSRATMADRSVQASGMKAYEDRGKLTPEQIAADRAMRGIVPVRPARIEW